MFRLNRNFDNTEEDSPFNEDVGELRGRRVVEDMNILDDSTPRG
jgi:hypothetical protein